jgi:hypothetical protein
MNEIEINLAASNFHSCQNVRQGVKFLKKLMDSVNDQSDGWCYWNPPAKSADQLIRLLKTAGNLNHDTDGTISSSDLRKAIGPIRRMVKVQGEKQKQYGNTFFFDVDAALRG